jgi:hypothetical protein
LLSHETIRRLRVDLKYGGEALVLLGIAWHLIRWIIRAVADGEAELPIAATTSGSSGLMISNPFTNGPPDPPIVAGFGSPPPPTTLFSPAMLAAMTPVQRARVLESLATQRAAAARGEDPAMAIARSHAHPAGAVSLQKPTIDVAARTTPGGTLPCAAGGDAPEPA